MMYPRHSIFVTLPSEFASHSANVFLLALESPIATSPTPIFSSNVSSRSATSHSIENALSSHSFASALRCFAGYSTRGPSCFWPRSSACAANAREPLRLPDEPTCFVLKGSVAFPGPIFFFTESVRDPVVDAANEFAARVLTGEVFAPRGELGRADKLPPSLRAELGFETSLPPGERHGLALISTQADTERAAPRVPNNYCQEALRCGFLFFCFWLVETCTSI